MQASGERAVAPRKPPKARSLLPKEHGAWVQLLFPLATALAVGRLTPAALAFALAACAFFFAHEPALLLLGHRGARARTAYGAAARRRLVLLGSLGAAGAVVGLVLGDTAVRSSAVAVASMAAVVGWLALRRLERTVPGEILAALTLVGASVPVALAGGASPALTLAVAGVWAASFVAGTLAVRTVIARSKGRASVPLRVAAIFVVLVATAGGIWLSRTGAIPSTALIALAPSATLAVVFALVAPHARRLKQLGWSLAGAATATLVILVAGLS